MNTANGDSSLGYYGVCGCFCIDDGLQQGFVLTELFFMLNFIFDMENQNSMLVEHNLD